MGGEILAEILAESREILADNVKQTLSEILASNFGQRTVKYWQQCNAESREILADNVKQTLREILAGNFRRWPTVKYWQKFWAAHIEILAEILGSAH